MGHERGSENMELGHEVVCRQRGIVLDGYANEADDFDEEFNLLFSRSGYNDLWSWIGPVVMVSMLGKKGYKYDLRFNQPPALPTGSHRNRKIPIPHPFISL